MKKQTSFRKLGILKLLLVLGSITLLTACIEGKEPPVQDTRPTMRILFVGNDYTMANYMIYMVQAMAQNDPTSSFQIEVTAHAAASVSLAQLWNNPATKDVLTNTTWDYVVLQPHNMWASSDGSVYLTRQAISVWSSQVKALGAQPVFFMTWPLEATHSSYTDPKLPSLKNYKNMHRLIKGYSKALSNKYDMYTVPVGDYWLYAVTGDTKLNLYGADRSTPSLEGSYLTALVFYKMLVDGTLDDIAYVPEGMTKETQAELISIASTKLE